MADEVVSRPQLSHEPPALSPAADADGQLDSSSSVKRVKIDNASTAPLHHVAPTLSTLPAELLIEILAQLNTMEVRVAMRVCKTWRNAAESTARVWRNIAFKYIHDSSPYDRYAFGEKRLKDAVRKAGDQVISIELTNLSDYDIGRLCKLLKSSTHTLRHILWSSRCEFSSAASTVYELARRCPQLQTLELHCAEEGWTLDKFTQQACGLLRLDNFTLSVPSLQHGASPPLQPMIYDEAKAVSVEIDLGIGMSMTELARLLEINPGLERLALSGLWHDKAFARPRYLSAHALRSLSIRHPEFECDYDEELPNPNMELPLIDAPQLRKLEIDAGVLYRLTAASVANLDLLIMHVGFCCFFHPTFERSCLEIVEHHQGPIELVISEEISREVLELFTKAFFWPRLEKVDMRLDEGSASTLIRLIAARQAGARRATKGQYMSLLQEQPSQRMTGTLFDNRQRRITADFKLTPKVRSADILALTSSVQIDPSMPPLCSEVKWTIRIPPNTPKVMLGWLEAQSNVRRMLWEDD